jgi:hypothetical protein
MKKYIDYKNAISDKDLYDGLIGYGLFPSKIPNFLTSEDFLNFTKSFRLPKKGEPKDYIRYSSMRNINIPRQLGIPEPFAYTLQVKSLSDNWTEILNHFRDKTINDPFKISRIHIRKLYNRPELFEMNYTNFLQDGDPTQDIVIKSKYVVSADISNCFPSIYSHSIPWALVGKKTAKSNWRDKTQYYNQIDKHTRNIKYGETNGLLIGPHSSNLISEIILVSVDHKLSKKNFKFVRHIDDYTCYTETYEDAENFILCLSEELKEYELVLNSKKSKISPLPQASVKNWVTKLNHFNFTNSYKVNSKVGIRVKELKGFLDFAIELMLSENSDAAILNYAIKIISDKYLSKSAKEYYIKQIHHLVLLYPYLSHLLDKYVFDPHNVNKNDIRKIAQDVYSYGITRKIYEASTYAIYWALKYNFDIGIPSIKDDAISSLDCVFLTISYVYDKKHHPISYLNEYIDLSEDLNKYDFDRYWLYIYETLPHSDLKAHYKNMKRKGLTFIKQGFY